MEKKNTVCFSMKSLSTIPENRVSYLVGQIGDRRSSKKFKKMRYIAVSEIKKTKNDTPFPSQVLLKESDLTRYLTSTIQYEGLTLCKQLRGRGMEIQDM